MSHSVATDKRSRWLALIVLCGGMLMIVLDATIVNVALPAIQNDLGFSQSRLAWVVNAYLIAYAGLLLLAGRLGDLVGRKRILLIGLTVFTTASLLCGLSLSQEMLIVARFVQGGGGAMVAALILGMIVTMFPEPGEQARAIGVFSFVAAAGSSIGLLAGGFLTQAISWHWIFFVNLPIGVAAAALVARLIESEDGFGPGDGVDGLGALLITTSLMLGVFTIVGISEEGRSLAQTPGLAVVSMALLAGFVAREATAGNPLLPLGIFRSRTVSGANLIQALMVPGMFGVFFLGALYLQRVLGYDPLQIGLAFLPAALAIGGLAVEVAARMITRFGGRSVLVMGLTLLLAGLVLFTRAPVDAQYLVDVLPVMTLAGIGLGLSFPALMTLAMAEATPRDAGLASGLVSTSGQVGGALGLAVLATLATAETDLLLGKGETVASALTGGYHLAFGVSAGLVVVAIILAAAVLRPGATGQMEPEFAPDPRAADVAS